MVSTTNPFVYKKVLDKKFTAVSRLREKIEELSHEKLGLLKENNELRAKSTDKRPKESSLYFE